MAVRPSVRRRSSFVCLASDIIIFVSLEIENEQCECCVSQKQDMTNVFSKHTRRPRQSSVSSMEHTYRVLIGTHKIIKQKKKMNAMRGVQCKPQKKTDEEEARRSLGSFF